LNSTQTSEAKGDQQRAYWSSALRSDQTYVYFIQAGDSGPIKIGFTSNVDSRMQALQTGNYQQLNLLTIVPAPATLEKLYHDFMDRYRIRGEWFEGKRVSQLAGRVRLYVDRMIAVHEKGDPSPPSIYNYERRLVFSPAEKPGPYDGDRVIRWNGKAPDWVVDFPKERALRPRNHGGYTPYR